MRPTQGHTASKGLSGYRHNLSDSHTHVWVALSKEALHGGSSIRPSPPCPRWLLSPESLSNGHRVLVPMRKSRSQVSGRQYRFNDR